ncbi:MAG: hypothetical protein ONB05_11455, partial [candidate division KSB1 bacterium]|nr:hypothetical protein [candidate division KSB1 bacterium]
IDETDALEGIFVAADNVGRKYLAPQVYQALRSKAYHSILRKLGKLRLGTSFVHKELQEKLSSEEQKKFDNFLKRARELGVIVREEERGEYRFANQLYHLYVMSEALRAEKGRK